MSRKMTPAPYEHKLGCGDIRSTESQFGYSEPETGGNNYPIRYPCACWLPVS